MKLGKRTVYCLLLALVCVNILVRTPRTDHETGIDSFFVHRLAQYISEAGRIPWVLNGLGYFGLYPLSYPNAAPLLISGLSQTTGITEEGAILDLSFVYGIVGALAAFMMARAFRKDDLVAITTATIFSLAPRFMSFTFWTASSRNLFMVLIPIFVWQLLRSYHRPTVRNIAVLISVLVLMIATHRLTILMAVIIIAFVCAYVFILLHRVIRVQWPRYLLSPSSRRWTPRLAILWIVLLTVFMITGTGILDEYTTGEICTGTTLEARLCNLGVSITRSVGLALPFAIVGIFAFVRLRNKGFKEAFLVLSLLALTPTLFLRQYTGFYILPFLSLLAAFGVLSIAKVFPKHPMAAGAAIVATLVAMTGFGVVILNIEVQRSTSMSDSTYTTGLYLASMPPGNFVSNDGLMAIRVGVISGRSCLPVGGASTTSQSPELLAMGAVNATTVQSGEFRIPLGDLTIEDDSPFLLLGVDALGDWVLKILEHPVTDLSPRLVTKYSLQYFVENDHLRSAYVAYGNVVRDPFYAKFADSVHAQRYKLYDGTDEDVYLAFAPLE